MQSSSEARTHVTRVLTSFSSEPIAYLWDSGVRIEEAILVT